MKLSVDTNKKTSNITTGDIFIDEKGVAYLLTEVKTDSDLVYRMISMDGTYEIEYSNLNNLRWAVADGILAHYPKNQWELTLSRL